MDKIKEKLEKEQNALAELENKRKLIDEKISLKQKKINDLKNSYKCEQYAVIESKLGGLGISREDLLKALQNNDLLSLQEAIEKQINMPEEVEKPSIE